MKTEKRKHRPHHHRSHIRGKDWRGFYERNQDKWEGDNGITAIEEEVGYLASYEKRFMKGNG